MSRWSGVFPALTTQFTAEGRLDITASERHWQTILDSGVAGFVVLGSLGENNTLHRNEKLEVLRAAKALAQNKIPVVTGVSELSTGAAADYARAAAQAGADGLMVMPAMAYHSDPPETLHHYRTIAQAAGLPVIVYNNPIAYKVDITPGLLTELAQDDLFTTVKESSGDPRRVTDIFNALGDRYAVFAGVDDLAFECAALGATGWIAGIGLAFPEENQRLWNLMANGQWAEARDLYRWYTPLLHLDVGPKFVQNIKLAIQEVGLGAEHVRAPRLPLAGQEREAVLQTIHQALATRPPQPTSLP